jgi:hypothetical protein
MIQKNEQLYTKSRMELAGKSTNSQIGYFCKDKLSFILFAVNF